MSHYLLRFKNRKAKYVEVYYFYIYQADGKFLKQFKEEEMNTFGSIYHY